MAKRRTADESAPAPSTPDWVSRCVVEDWLTPEHLARPDATRSSLEVQAWHAWSRERLRWARDHQVARPLPLGGRPVWRQDTEPAVPTPVGEQPQAVDSVTGGEGAEECSTRSTRTEGR